jgi:hypothetical protein
MILDNFGDGWKNKFEQRIVALFKFFPDTTIQEIKRFEGMLRIKLIALDKDVQSILDSVTFKIERESVLTCETCGVRGRRTKSDDTYFPEKMCLCWRCYAIEIDSMESHS